jgi:hypothetical protein
VSLRLSVAYEWPGCSIWTPDDTIIMPYVLFAQSVFKIAFFLLCQPAFLYKTVWQCTNVLLTNCSLALGRVATVNYILFGMNS